MGFPTKVGLIYAKATCAGISSCTHYLPTRDPCVALLYETQRILLMLEALARVLPRFPDNF
jgi:hypothetical protein